MIYVVLVGEDGRPLMRLEWLEGMGTREELARSFEAGLLQAFRWAGWVKSGA